MTVMKRILMGISATVLAALLLTLIFPKTGHALVATLVQVTNSATAPALTLDVSKSASQHVELTCQIPINSFLCAINSGSTAYVVPPGQNLVVTSVDILAAQGGIANLILYNTFIPVAQWYVPADTLTHSFQYPSGIVFTAGAVFDSKSVVASSNVVEAILIGYLTPI